jgi:hypothetical protein
VTDYYRSPGLTVPVIYAQEEGRWLAYDAQGSATSTPGALPAAIIERTEPVEAAEAEAIIRDRRQATGAIAQAVDEPDGGLLGRVAHKLWENMTVGEDGWDPTAGMMGLGGSPIVLGRHIERDTPMSHTSHPTDESERSGEE